MSVVGIKARNALDGTVARLGPDWPNDPLDFEATIEATVLELATRFQLVAVRYDPYQMVSSAQRLTAAGIPMVEFPQTTPNLTEASSNLYELIKPANLIAYPRCSRAARHSPRDRH